MNSEVAQSATLPGRILAEHAAALSDAESAIEHARRCGTLLSQAKQAVGHGDWLPWLEANCPDVPARTAQRYIQLSRAPALGADSIRSALAKLAAPKPANATRATHLDSVQKPGQPRRAPPEIDDPAAKVADDEGAPSAAEIAEAEASEVEYRGSIAKVMAADDKLAAAHAEIKRQAAEIAGLKIARNTFMDARAAVEKLLAAEQRKTDRLRKKLDVVRGEVDELRQKLEHLEAAPGARFTAAQLMDISEFLQERVAIAEVDGELPRQVAEHQAVRDATLRWPALGGLLTPANGDATTSDTPDYGWSADEPLPF